MTSNSAPLLPEVERKTHVATDKNIQPRSLVKGLDSVDLNNLGIYKHDLVMRSMILEQYGEEKEIQTNGNLGWRE